MLLALALLTIGIVAAIAWLFIAGIGIWGINIPVAWGFAISNYVWWIGMASGGTMISSLFHVMRAEWRSAVNRIAETMTLFAAACAGIFPILHLGRPGLFYWLFPLSQRDGSMKAAVPQPAALGFLRHPDLCPLLDPVLVCGRARPRSPQGPCATCARHRSGQVFYGLLALGWRGSGSQWQHYQTAYRLLAALMGPLVISVHSIVGLDFAAGLTPGWHSTQYPPFFVFGAALSGFAIVLVLVIPIRRLYRLESAITSYHLDILARLTLLASLAVAYAYLMDVFTAFYGGDPHEIALAIDRFTGPYAALYWTTILLQRPGCRNPLWFACRVRDDTGHLLFAVAACAVFGMWCERVMIVVVSLSHEFRAVIVASVFSDDLGIGRRWSARPGCSSPACCCSFDCSPGIVDGRDARPHRPPGAAIMAESLPPCGILSPASPAKPS